ncbi:NUDIX hydrolase [Candidatus Protofrankia datiscae]|uniref:NUDIX hydrolase n=1 Tax=Candidatus Protofrankia datiscae TaxID=2716812 RepID=F8AYP2_9ACTN|nr:NUDIX hydrolase [Candidatus Protofrankia datiscae]AEH07699.1 NUDIX hydrolase [Candidatus Protofrankia datiscae]AEH11617.1 NUDIX hydrolase [Candidatus Protofrankia datiscae]
MGIRETVRLTADVVALTIHNGIPHVLLIRRGWDPYAGRWALPGGHVDPGETATAAARRELAEETGVFVDIADLKPVGTYSDPDRDPRGRYVTVAFAVRLHHALKPTAGDDATAARWIPVHRAVADGLAFDHARILTDTLTTDTLSKET